MQNIRFIYGNVDDGNFFSWIYKNPSPHFLSEIGSALKDSHVYSAKKYRESISDDDLFENGTFEKLCQCHSNARLFSEKEDFDVNLNLMIVSSLLAIRDAITDEVHSLILHDYENVNFLENIQHLSIVKERCESRVRI